MKNLFAIILLCLSINAISQTRIDGSFSFQTDPAKKYSLYIPSDYQTGTPHRLMLALHPLNTNRWDAESWCDTLIAFAETNSLILACPDGGPDGAVDDPIDTAFTTVLLDSVAIWYDVNPNKTYAMGFSWGGKTTYTYGLNHIDKFRGFMPIGAAVNVSEVTNVVQNANGKPYYLVHGSNDTPNVRFTPLLNALNNNDAITNSLLMPGVGHTIDFPDRNQILTTAFEWLDSVNCASLTTPIIDIKLEPKIEMYPNPLSSETSLNLVLPNDGVLISTVNVYSVKGELMLSKGDLEQGLNVLNLSINPGPYFIHFMQGDKTISVKKLFVL